MTDNKNKLEYIRALEDFKHARAKARMQHLWAAITGEPKELLHYDEISKQMHAVGGASKGVQEIPIDSIVGSVNRFEDFDKNFLPLRDSDMQRWANVKTSMTSPGSPGLPPISVYKIGDAYFVLDGNHRVSIAKQMDAEKIEAYVSEIKTKVPLSTDDSPEEIILKSEYADFLEETHFDKAVPGVSLEISFPGLYETLKEHIRVHRHYMGIEQSREISLEEADRHWYEYVYRPIVEVIREQNILQEFPQRTETDLYIWLLDHQTYMQEKLGWSIRPEKAASDFVRHYGKRLIRVVRRVWQKLLKVLLPNPLEDFSSPGEWHKQKREHGESLFSDILVAINGSPESWIALEQAILIGKMENADVRGLVVNEEKGWESEKEGELSAAFSERLLHSGLQGNMVFAQGDISETITDRAQFNDLIVLKLSHPPSPKILRKLSSGMRTILRRSSRPIMVVRNQISKLDHLLLAYDGSLKGKEALFVSAYFANKFQTQLTVLVVDKNSETGQKLLNDAENYLGNCCQNALFKKRSGRIAREILRTADEEGVDTILMGGYGFSPILEVLFGSTVDSVLRGTSVPVVVCQ